jgi:hypothetical protein
VGKARDCRSCHADPVALGYGEGVLLYEPEGDGGKWRFTPERSPGPDGLPADAWTGFLRERAAAASTRAGARPFNVAEQRRILTVGACLTCHDPTADGLGLQSCAKAGAAGAGGSTPCTPMPRFPDALARASSWCRLPRW